MRFKSITSFIRGLFENTGEEERVDESFLLRAHNVDVSATGRIIRRTGYGYWEDLTENNSLTSVNDIPDVVGKTGFGSRIQGIYGYQDVGGLKFILIVANGKVYLERVNSSDKKEWVCLNPTGDRDLSNLTDHVDITSYLDIVFLNDYQNNVFMYNAFTYSETGARVIGNRYAYFAGDKIYIRESVNVASDYHEHDIANVTTGAGGTFHISGDFEHQFTAGDTFIVEDSTNNDGEWTVNSVSYDSGDGETDITVDGGETVGAVADGTLKSQYRIKIEDNISNIDGKQIYDSLVEIDYILPSGGVITAASDLKLGTCQREGNATYGYKYYVLDNQKNQRATGKMYLIKMSDRFIAEDYLELDIDANADVQGFSVYDGSVYIFCKDAEFHIIDVDGLVDNKLTSLDGVVGNLVGVTNNSSVKQYSVYCDTNGIYVNNVGVGNIDEECMAIAPESTLDSVTTSDITARAGVDNEIGYYYNGFYYSISWDSSVAPYGDWKITVFKTDISTGQSYVGTGGISGPNKTGDAFIKDMIVVSGSIYAVGHYQGWTGLGNYQTVIFKWTDNPTSIISNGYFSPTSGGGHRYCYGVTFDGTDIWMTEKGYTNSALRVNAAITTLLGTKSISNSAHGIAYTPLNGGMLAVTTNSDIECFQKASPYTTIGNYSSIGSDLRGIRVKQSTTPLAFFAAYGSNQVGAINIQTGSGSDLVSVPDYPQFVWIDEANDDIYVGHSNTKQGRMTKVNNTSGMEKLFSIAFKEKSINSTRIRSGFCEYNGYVYICIGNNNSFTLGAYNFFRYYKVYRFKNDLSDIIRSINIAEDGELGSHTSGESYGFANIDDLEEINPVVIKDDFLYMGSEISPFDSSRFTQSGRLDLSSLTFDNWYTIGSGESITIINPVDDDPSNLFLLKNGDYYRMSSSYKWASGGDIYDNFIDFSTFGTGLFFHVLQQVISIDTSGDKDLIEYIGSLDAPIADPAIDATYDINNSSGAMEAGTKLKYYLVAKLLSGKYSRLSKASDIIEVPQTYGYRDNTWPGSDKVSLTPTADHGYNNDDPVDFIAGSGSTLPTNLSEGTTYYVINRTNQDFEVAATPGGTKITLSGQTGSNFTVSPPLHQPIKIIVSGINLDNAVNISIYEKEDVEEIQVYRQQLDNGASSYTIPVLVAQIGKDVDDDFDYTPYSDGTWEDNEQEKSFNPYTVTGALSYPVNNILVHKNRLIMVNRIDIANPNVIQYSDLDYAESIPEDNIRAIESGDGDTLVSGISMGDYLYLFKKQKIYAILGDVADGQLVDVDKTIGCPYKNLITKYNNAIYFLNRNGVFVASGQRVENLSRFRLENYFDTGRDDCIDFINADQNGYAFVDKKKKEIRFHVPRKVDGISSEVNNLVIIYNTELGYFKTYEYFNPMFIEDEIEDVIDGEIEHIAGDYEGNIFKFNNQINDNNKPIRWTVLTKEYDLGAGTVRKHFKLIKIQGQFESEMRVTYWIDGVRGDGDFIQRFSEIGEQEGLTRVFNGRNANSISIEINGEEVNQPPPSLNAILIGYDVKRGVR